MIVVMGVSGSGKSTIGAALAARLDARFLDADDLHPAANLRKMRAGEPLSEADRAPWLAAIVDRLVAQDPSVLVILACSALRRGFRDALRAATPGIRFILLQVPERIARRRVEKRTGHFMPATLVSSQFAALEPPTCDEDDILVLDAGRDAPPVDMIVARSIAWLNPPTRQITI